MLLVISAAAIFFSYRMFHFGEADVMMDPFARQHDAVVRVVLFAIAALVTHVHESEIMKSILPWSIVMLLGLCVLVFLQSSVLYPLVP